MPTLAKVLPFGRKETQRRPNYLNPNKDKRDYAHKPVDPDLDMCRTLIIESGLTNNAIARKAWLSPTTIANIVDGKTKRPQNTTIHFLLLALGKKRIIVDI